MPLATSIRCGAQPRTVRGELPARPLSVDAGSRLDHLRRYVEAAIRPVRVMSADVICESAISAAEIVQRSGALLRHDNSQQLPEAQQLRTLRSSSRRQPEWRRERSTCLVLLGDVPEKSLG